MNLNAMVLKKKILILFGVRGHLKFQLLLKSVQKGENIMLLLLLEQ